MREASSHVEGDDMSERKKSCRRYFPISICPKYYPRNSYIDSVAYVYGYPNYETDPGQDTKDNTVGFAVVGSAIVG